MPEPTTKSAPAAAGAPLPWFRRGSLFDRALQAKGYERVEQDHDPTTPDPGYWSTDMAGLLIQDFQSWLLGLRPTRETVWKDQGWKLQELINERVAEWTRQQATVTVIAHSHGGQVAAFALQQCGIRPRLVTIDMPVRRKMQPEYAAVQLELSDWTHLYSSRFTFYRLFGSRFGAQECPYAHTNVYVRGGHTGVLTDPEHMDQLLEVL